MNIAVIIAGGSGQRMGQDIPKQLSMCMINLLLFITLEGFSATSSDRMPLKWYALMDGMMSFGLMLISLISPNLNG